MYTYYYYLIIDGEHQTLYEYRLTPILYFIQIDYCYTDWSQLTISFDVLILFSNFNIPS